MSGKPAQEPRAPESDAAARRYRVPGGVATEAETSAGAGRWLVKSEPAAFSWDDLVRAGRATWDGVRNYQARNHLRAMRAGDLALFYHSVVGKCVVGVCRVVREAFPDPTATEGDWSAVEVVPVDAFAHPVALAAIKADEQLAQIALLRQSRLSVVPLTSAEYARLCSLGRGEGSGRI